MRRSKQFQPSKYANKRPRRERDPLPWVKYTIRLADDMKLKELRLCIERVLGLDEAARVLGIVKLQDSIWKYDPRDPDAELADHYVDDEVVKKRIELLKAGKTADLPIQLERAFEFAKEWEPKLGPQIMRHRFAVLTLPILRRTFQRTACNPNGRQFDVGYAIEKACGRIKVTPCIPHPVGLQSGALGAMFPPRAEPAQTGTPDTARWHLFNIGAVNAAGNSLFPALNGTGVTIGHPDTGWTPHPQLNFNASGVSFNYPVGFDLNLINPAATSALEPIPAPPIPFTNPFHGTRTGSILVSGLDATVAGLAPGATVFPVRCVRDVVILSPELDDELIATAIVTSVVAGAQVISISLGGYPSECLRWAVQFAVLSNVIVVAAAGNFWPLTVFPAGYPECIGVGGSTADNARWAYSGRNWLGFTPINIAAPSEFVRNATWNAAGAATRGSNHGTSFGTAIVAAAAALWLQRNGRTALINALGGRAPLQALFAVHLAVTATTPAGWNTLLDGPGILNLTGLLNPATMPSPATFPIPAGFVSMMSGLASGASLRTGGMIANPLSGGLPSWFTAMFGGDAAEIAQNFAEETLQLVMGNPLVSGMIEALESAAKAAEDAATAVGETVGDAVEDAAEAAEEAAETVSEVVEEVVDAVSDAASDTVSTVAGWLGF